MIFEIGRVCVKIAGKDSGKLCVIADRIDDNFVIIDGNLKRKKCNIKHLEPTEKKLNIDKNSTTNEIYEEMEKSNIKVRTKKAKAASEKPKRIKKEKEVKTEVKKSKK
jgi:large subunit ribosomal protein L14e